MSFENPTPKIYHVSELTNEIQNLLESRFDFVWVEGEISNFSAPASGHYYMTLKDSKSQLRAVMFRFQVRSLRFAPENGMHVLAQGRLGVYPPRGEYQIILDYLEPMGVGALALAFDQLKRKLADQGIFDENIKKPLPFLPQRVAIVTSPSGAAVRDFLKIIRRRYSNLEITLVPVRVQGEEACRDMVNALALVNRELDADVIVLTRGGGSLEDLWAFNQEELALAIRRSDIPVVSAVGHEIDLTISDLAADFRAPTPSAAAELLVLEKESLLNRLDEMKTRLMTGMNLVLRNSLKELRQVTSRLKHPRKQLDETWMRLDEIYLRLIRLMDRVIRERKKMVDTQAHTLRAYSPINLISTMNQTLDFQISALTRAMTTRLKDMRSSLSVMEKRITDLSPMSILKRGYSITKKLPENEVLKDISGVKIGDRVQVLLANGKMSCRIEKL